MSKYIKKSFSPHIYQDWIHLFRQCSPEQRSELLLAITDFPNHEPEIEISIWDFIKSQLDTQYQSMENKSQRMSTNRNSKKQKSTDVDRCRPKSTEVDRSSQIEIETGIETRIETEIKEKEISNDISKKNNQIDNQNEKPKSKFNENSIIYVNGQYFDEFPPESIPLLKKHWSLEELEDIRKRMAFKPEHQTTVAQMLVEYPPKPKKKSYGEQQKVKLTDEEYSKLKELYGDYMDSAIDTLDRYLATNNKKYASHYAVMRKGNWVYNQIMKNKLDDERGF